MNFTRNIFQKNVFFSGWVISKRLERDEIFLEQAQFVFKKVKAEVVGDARQLDPSFYWLKAKYAIINLAKCREKELEREENFRKDLLNGYYSAIMEDLFNGVDCYNELEDIKKQLNVIYQDKSQRKVDKMRGLEIDTPNYDIHKLQNQRKYENQSRIREIKIGDIVYKGNAEVVEGIESKIKNEVKQFGDLDFDAPISQEEELFLGKMEKLILTDGEKEDLLRPTSAEEITFILNNEVDLDSSPGEDGITYRFIKLFWDWSEYRFIYLKFLNFTRDYKSYGVMENLGIMTVKNKKAQSNDYEKKRKLTKLNKDISMGNGKVWVNRLKNLIIPKILPKNQFNCQKEVNIVDEIREIRNVNIFLLGDEILGQREGTIMSIDFQNAFRSTSLRWFNLVMKRMEFPQGFIDWFWTMYRGLATMIVVNRYKSEKIFIERGFMEGHAPSMAAFVIALIPLMISLEEVMTGIVTPDEKCHKVKMFADDLKLFIKDLNEIENIYDRICKFEKISGLKMHRDPSRDKCQALPFGRHRAFKEWPVWVSVKNNMKVVGAYFSNNECMDKLNTENVSKAFYFALQKAFGVRGTIFQKAYFVNTYLFSKIWYLSQCFKLDGKILDKMLGKAFEFIYAGENERPVRPVNFRNKHLGGLGLIHPKIKAKAFLIKNMYFDFIQYNCNITDKGVVNNLYGYSEDFVGVYKEGLAMASVKEIYEFLLQDMVYCNGSLIPSRREKRSQNIKWSLVWQNVQSLKGLTQEEKCFAWKTSQDMLPVGSRVHRKNAERRCLRVLENGQNCLEIEDLEHRFRRCENVQRVYNGMVEILEAFLGQKVNFNHLIHFAINHRNKKKLVAALWLAVKVMYKIFQEKNRNNGQILREMLKEIDWNINMTRKVGSRSELRTLKEIILLKI